MVLSLCVVAVLLGAAAVLGQGDDGGGLLGSTHPNTAPPGRTRATVGTVVAVTGRLVTVESLPYSGPTGVPVAGTDEFVVSASTSVAESTTGAMEDVEIGDHITVFTKQVGSTVVASTVVDDTAAPTAREVAAGRASTSTDRTALRGRVTSLSDGMLTLRETEGEQHTMSIGGAAVTVVRAQRSSEVEVGDGVLVLADDLAAGAVELMVTGALARPLPRPES